MCCSRTNELLLSFLRADLGGSGPESVGELSSGDWDDLLQTSARHQVAPLLYHCLSNSPEDFPVAAEVLRSLRNSYLQSAARNAHLFHELGRVLVRLRQDDIQVIALKGAHLAEVIYGNIALRPMNDVDLLVRTDDLGRAEEILLGMGYLPEDYTRRVAQDNCQFTYKQAGSGLIVEVHWEFLPASYRFTIDMAGVWERSMPCLVAGVEVSALCPEDQVLYLCLHASKHLFSGMGLKPLYDIAKVIRHYHDELDWEQVRFRGEQWGIQKCVYVILTFVGKIFEISLPADLMRAVTPADVDEQFMILGREQIFSRGHRTSDGISVTSNVALLFGSRRMKRKAALFLKRVFPSSDEMSRLYPAPPDSLGVYFYYPARIRDLLLRYGRQVWRLVRDSTLRGRVQQENEITFWRDWLLSPGRTRERAMQDCENYSCKIKNR